MKSNKAVIFGSVGVNRGDDLMNRVLVNACIEAGLEPVVATLDPDFIKKTYKQKAFLSSKSNIIGWLREIKGARCVIVGGGTVVQNDFNRGRVSGILAYAVIALLLAKLIFWRKVYFLGVGINKVTSTNRLIAKFLVFADLILVRDEVSIANARTIGSLSNVEKAWDIGLCKSLYDSIDFRPKNNEFPTQKYLCLSLAKEEHAEKALALGRLVIDYAISSGFSVKLIAMDVRPLEEISLFEQLVEEYRGRGACLEIVAPDTPYHIEAVVSGSAACVGMRLHFCVICLVNGLSPIVFSREQKSEWISNFVGEKRFVRHDDGLFPEKILRALDREDEARLPVAVTEQLKEIDFAVRNRLIRLISGNV